MEEASARGWEALALPAWLPVSWLIELAGIEMKRRRPWRAWDALQRALTQGGLSPWDLNLLLPWYRPLSGRYFPWRLTRGEEAGQPVATFPRGIEPAATALQYGLSVYRHPSR